MERVDNGLVWQMVDKTKLPFPTVRALMLRGWTYEESVDSVPRWVAPIAQLKKDS